LSTKVPVEFFKAFGVVIGLSGLLGVSILIMAKGTGLLSLIPFFAYLVGFVYIFAKFGCLPSTDEHH